MVHVNAQGLESTRTGFLHHFPLLCRGDLFLLQSFHDLLMQGRCRSYRQAALQIARDLAGNATGIRLIGIVDKHPFQFID